MSLLLEKSPNKVFLSIVLGVLAGFAYSSLIPLTLIAIEPLPFRLFEARQPEGYWIGSIEITKPRLALTFLGVCLFIMIMRALSQILLARVSISAATDLRIRLYQRILRMPIQALETMGSSRLLVALTMDIPQIINGISIMPMVYINVVAVIGLLGFVFYQDADVFYFVIGALVFGVVTYRVAILWGASYIKQARVTFESLQESMRGLLYGAKELKLNQEKRQAFWGEDLIAAEDQYTKHLKNGKTILNAAVSYGDLIAFVALGMVIFILVEAYTLPQDVMLGTLMAMLYITTPMVAILNNLSTIQEAKVSLASVHRLLQSMPEESQGDAPKDECPQWECIRLERLTHEYPGLAEKNHFVLGPIDLTLRKGEITFLVGGNGSGKSTLGKLIALHYFPTSGALSFDEVIIDESNRNLYREAISAISTDFYLFSKIAGVANVEELDRLAGKYLKELELSDKVHVQDNRLSTLSLSDGQRKRLALLVAYLENRELFVFDEWAADQDPVFKDVFYNQILLKLKQQGKAILVISHDDRYFHIADQLVRMETGQIVEIQRGNYETQYN